MARPRHSKKEIEAAVAYAKSGGWTFLKTSGRAHAWGILRCPRGEREGCSISVQATPRVPHNHAEQVRKRVDGCPH